MPRDGSGVFSLPPGTTNFVALTTIESDKIDAITGDLQADANTARPIVAGGTGASTVIGAFDAFQTHGADIATAATLVLDGATGEMVDLTGTTSVTAVTLASGKRREARAAGALKLTASASLIVNGSTTQSYTCSAGDLLCFEGYASSVVRVWVIARSLDSTSRARRNRMVNPCGQISQENVNTAGTTHGYYAWDQFAMYRVTSAGTFTAQRVQSVTPKGSKDRFRVTITAADAALAAGEYCTITTNLEGNNVADFQYGGASAKQSVLTFLWKSPAGTYSIALHNSAANRSYVAQFTPTAANTDQYISIVIPGDTSGTWLTDTGIGITADFVIAAGSTFQGTNAAWQSGNIMGVSTNTNGVGTINSVFEVSDVQLNLDPDLTGVAPAFELQDYGQVLRDSSRYYYAVSASYVGQTYSATLADVAVPFATPMRAAPTCLGSPPSVTTSGGSSAAVTWTTSISSAAGALMRATAASGLVAGNATVATGSFTFNARM